MDRALQRDISELPGLKATDLKPCHLCGKHYDNPVFYRVSVKQFVLDAKAIERQIGLSMMLGGNATIAQAMGPNEDMAKQTQSHTALLCSECAMKMPVLSVLAVAADD